MRIRCWGNPRLQASHHSLDVHVLLEHLSKPSQGRRIFKPVDIVLVLGLPLLQNVENGCLLTVEAERRMSGESSLHEFWILQGFFAEAVEDIVLLSLFSFKLFSLSGVLTSRPLSIATFSWKEAVFHVGCGRTAHCTAGSHL